MNKPIRLTIAAAVALLVAACTRECPPCDKAAATEPVVDKDAVKPILTCTNGGESKLRDAAQQPVQATAENVVATIDKDFEAAAEERADWKDKPFEEYLQTVQRECGPDGKFLVNGDVAISDVKQLKEFYETRVQNPAAVETKTITIDGREFSTRALILATTGGEEAKWNSQQKQTLTYCVSDAFGGLHGKVLADMKSAAGAWEQVSNVKFTHVAGQDANCTKQNGAVLFDVNPVDVDGDYLARAFFPGEPRSGRNVYIDLTALALDPSRELKLAGVLRHELGHTLGFRHEHTRPESGACFEDSNFVPITGYDKLSVMHYPQCNGGTSWALVLTDKDKSGAACVYGGANDFTFNPTLIENPARCLSEDTPPPPDAPTVKSFPNQSVARGALKDYPAANAGFAAKPGSILKVAMKPNGRRPGDPDLYVLTGARPQVQPPKFTCRPYRTGALESCEITVPPSPKNLVRILVHGYTAGKYDLEVSYVPL